METWREAVRCQIDQRVYFTEVLGNYFSDANRQISLDFVRSNNYYNQLNKLPSYVSLLILDDLRLEMFLVLLMQSPLSDFFLQGVDPCLYTKSYMIHAA